MFRRRPEKPGSGYRVGVAPWVADQSVPARACCCPARPVVKVVMGPAARRPEPADLWLCGHHYRSSRAALAAADARVYELVLPGAEADPGHGAAIAR